MQSVGSPVDEMTRESYMDFFRWAQYSRMYRRAAHVDYVGFTNNTITLYVPESAKSARHRSLLRRSDRVEGRRQV